MSLNTHLRRIYIPTLMMMLIDYCWYNKKHIPCHFPFCCPSAFDSDRMRGEERSLIGSHQPQAL